MYDWLGPALHDGGTVVTANRRLARLLADHYSAAQLAAGKKAWRSPSVYAWPDWLVALSCRADGQADLPTRINAHQSQLLWERCLRKSLDPSDAGIAALARLCRDTWQRIADWQVSITAIARSARSEDQRLFASVTGRYLGILARENWVDDAELGSLILDMIRRRRLPMSGGHCFVGFGRQRPIVLAVQEAMAAAGVATCVAPDKRRSAPYPLQPCVDSTAELRSAGAWARQHIEHNPNARVAIIANDLDKRAEAIARRVRDGATPGWQHGHASLFDAVNVSYGRRLQDYPAITIALGLLRWLVDDLPSADVSVLLRSPLLGMPGPSGRSRLDLSLRQWPDRRWSPSMVSAELRGHEDGEDVCDWLARLAVFGQSRRALPTQASPTRWAVLIDEILRDFGWPGQSALDSGEFQLINRWRELQNEFARLGLVSPTMTATMAVTRLLTMAGDTVFQPESSTAVVQLMGPLEATGAQFDALWLTGVTTGNWPPAGTPSALLSRQLQERYGMPDCTPADTLAYAADMLGRLIGSSKTVLCSYALSENDTGQTASDLLRPLAVTPDAAWRDPGWYAASLASIATPQPVKDNVPAVSADEKISGGAGMIQRHLRDPLAAFIHGRLGARVIFPQAIGILPSMRGHLIHDALYKLYIDLPNRDSIRTWRGEDLTARIADAVNFAFRRHERNPDAVLRQLLLLERSRVSALLRQFVVVDGTRDDFKIASVEGKFEFVAGQIRLPLRFDRIDSVGDGGIAILDYKTGSKKRLLNREKDAQEIQLFVYACATDARVSALALINIDSREIAVDGAGLGYTASDEWPSLLHRVKARIATACEEISGGDVRLNIEQGITAARPLNVLTRYTELRRSNA